MKKLLLDLSFLVNNKSLKDNLYLTLCKNGLFLFALLSSFTVNAQENNVPFAISEKVVPNIFTSAAGPNTFLGPLATSQRTYQLLIAASELTDMVGKNLISISFRNRAAASAAWPTSDVTYNNYDIYLSESVNPANRSFTFANNVVGIQTQVRSGSLLIPANSLSFGSSPNAFSYDINFTTPWNYTGGNLLVEIRHDGFTGSSNSVDAAGTSTAGYGSLYSACWASSYTATSTTTQGNFAVVNFKADDNLGLDIFNSQKIGIYPNPTSDFLTIQTTIQIDKVRLFNMMGQVVLEKDITSQDRTLSIAQLNIGTYLLQIESENGIVNKRIIKN